MEKRKTELELQGIKYNWINELGNMIDKYNNTKHSTIKMTPIEASKKENEEKLIELYNNKEESKEDAKFNAKHERSEFKLGDVVRLWKKKTTFEKGYTTRFTKELFRIQAIHYTNPIQYSLTDMEYKPIIGKVYEWEVIKSNEGSSIPVGNIQVDDNIFHSPQY